MLREPRVSLLYRYFFFGWLFRDAGRGDWLERCAALRYNKAHADWLLVYLKRWLVVGLVFGIGGGSSVHLSGVWIGGLFFIAFSLAVAVSLVIIAAWLGLRFRPGA